MVSWMYGSFAIGEGDRFSDIEFYLFFTDETSGDLREEAWVAQIAPLCLYYVNEFGNGTAIFENLVRGEFHFEAAPSVGLVDAWQSAWFPSLAGRAPSPLVKIRYFVPPAP